MKTCHKTLENPLKPNLKMAALLSSRAISAAMLASMGT
jgi:hypothetical protein